MKERRYYVYIMTNKRKNVLYIGVTRDLAGRVFQHKSDVVKGFTSKYKVSILVYYEEYDYVYTAISREKQIKGYRREKKEKLIKSMNINWNNLSQDWF